jgi:HK97 family phage prohead protease
MKKDYINNIPDAERRVFQGHKLQVRADESGKKTIRGYAAIYNSVTDLGWCKEIIVQGAFDDCLNDDVRCLFNHDSDNVLGRTLSGTCRVGSDYIGLWYECDLDENNTDHMNLWGCIKRGDITQSSFAFSIAECEWEFGSEEYEGEDLRRIIKCGQLFDVSPVTYPAYQNTSVSARSKYDYEIQKKELLEAKAKPKSDADAFAMKYRNFKLKNNIQK